MVIRDRLEVVTVYLEAEVAPYVILYPAIVDTRLSE